MSLNPSKDARRKAAVLFVWYLLIPVIIFGFTSHTGAESDEVIFPEPPRFHEQGEEDGTLAAPFVVTSMKVVRRLLDMGSVGPADFLVDLGSGDGRIVITAAKEYGASGFGVDFDKDLVALSKKNAVAKGVENKVNFFVRDIFKTDIRKASIVTMYLLKDVNIKLRPKLLAELKPGSRIISHDFHLGEWRPDEMVHMDIAKFYRNDTFLYLWIVHTCIEI